MNDIREILFVGQGAQPRRARAGRVPRGGRRSEGGVLAERE